MRATIEPSDRIDNPPEPPEPVDSWRDGLDLRLGVLAVGLFAAILALHGLLPGQAYNNPAKYQLAGMAECVAGSPRSLITAVCPDVGIPVGAPQLSLLPVVVTAGVVASIPGIGGDVAASVSLIAWLAVAMAAGFVLLRHLGAGPVASVLGAVAYLATPTVIGLRGLGGTYVGVALLPAFALADVLLIERMTRKGRVPALGIAGYVLVRCTAAFMDGYSFVMSALVTAVLLAAVPFLPGRDVPLRRWFADRSRLGRWLTAGAITAAANLAAVAAYMFYVPGGAYAPAPIDQFRAAGADLVTVIAPSARVWWAALTGLTVDTATLWGNGVNARWNYLGLIGAALAVVYVVRRRHRRWVVPLAVAGAIALVLSFGPSLKIDDRRDEPRPSPVTREWYQMPPEAATAQLPTSWLFSNVPGMDTMRATYRWGAVTRMAVVILATLALSDLARRPGARTKVAVAVLAVAATVDLLPDVPATLTINRANHLSRVAFYDDALGEVRSLTTPGETVFFLPTGNDYLANVLVPEAGLRSYNVGGDKNVVLSVDRRPPILVRLTRSGDPEHALRAFEDSRLDAIILVNYSLRWNSYRWPPANGPTPIPERYRQLVEDPRFTVERGRWHTVIRHADSA